ncbi:ATP-binding protein [Promicromonospora sp. NPDC057138]|uniref:ATP-binding protein n=1 Tax=Promicromonospora sp. NPDC057138 TaxID=3346031 RepID=UPI00363F9EAE
MADRLPPWARLARPAAWPLRLRVALAFLLAAALALTLLGVFVQVRVADALEQRTHDLLEAQAEGLVAVPRAERVARVEAMTGDIHAQLLDGDGRPLASSPLVAGPLVSAADLAALPPRGSWSADRVVVVLDDDAVAAGDQRAEREPAVLLVTRADQQLVAVATSREDIEEALDAVRVQLVTGVPLALVVAGALGYLVAGAGLRPVERVRERAARISDRSSGERLPVPPAHDELRRLVVTLNAMLDRLDDGLHRQRRFVAEASHELRTPLTLLRTEVDLALARPRSNEELSAALRSVGQETTRLTVLAENLLTLAAADEGRLALVREPVDLAELARRVVERFAPSASGPISTTGDDAVVVHADRERLDQVLSNLVDNALRHGAPPVEIDVRLDGERVRLTVTDHGRGFTVQDPFDRFVSTHGSAGLGLAIVKEIVAAHDGNTYLVRRDGTTSVVVDLPAGAR